MEISLCSRSIDVCSVIRKIVEGSIIEARAHFASLAQFYYKEEKRILSKLGGGKEPLKVASSTVDFHSNVFSRSLLKFVIGVKYYYSCYVKKKRKTSRSC